MQYGKVKVGEHLIEIFNDWTGKETVVLDGQIVSQASSVFGTSHSFDVEENNELIPYLLTTKLDQSTMAVTFDVLKEGKIIYDDIPLPYSLFTLKKRFSKKKEAEAHLNEFELEEALAKLKKVLKHSPNDPEVHLYLARIYSVQEATEKGFDHLRQSLDNNLIEPHKILQDPMLAFLRMQEGFTELLDEFGISPEDAN